MNRFWSLILLLFALPALIQCQSPDDAESEPDDSASLSLGIERLLNEERHLVEGKRLGIITNHSALLNGEHIVDLIHNDPELEITALFGPEHGIRGTADAGEPVDHGVDEATGIPVYSLYGEHRRPTPEMLEEVDVLLFDIQDVGARYYTYVITMGRSMISAAEAGIPFVVLDRPNPLGGEKIEGHIREDQYQSGIGMYPTPITHGMTAGELAQMILGEGWHEGLEGLELHVVEMAGWTRDMIWADTGLEWVAPSPNLPDIESTYVYPGTCLFEGTRASEGRGTYEPFIQVGSPFVDADAVAAELNRRELPGVRFESVTFIPESIDGMSKEPKLLGETVHGVKLEVLDPDVMEPTAMGVHLLEVFYEALPDEEKENFFIERGIQIRTGNDHVHESIISGESMENILNWESDVEAFRAQRIPYLIYP